MDHRLLQRPRPGGVHLLIGAALEGHSRGCPQLRQLSADVGYL